MIARTMLHHSTIEIRDEISHLARMVDQAILDGVRALLKRDETLARHVGAHDSFLNDLRLAIEEKCYALLATQQLAPTDYRIIVGAVNVATNLERIGDHAAGIARLTLRMGNSPYPAATQHLLPMAETARELVQGAVKAFVGQDDLLAEAVVRRDREIDEFYEQVYTELAALLAKDDLDAESAMFLLRAAHNLERIGERATNICERTIYVVTGELKEFG